MKTTIELKKTTEAIKMAFQQTGLIIEKLKNDGIISDHQNELLTDNLEAMRKPMAIFETLILEILKNRAMRKQIDLIRQALDPFNSTEPICTKGTRNFKNYFFPISKSEKHPVRKIKVKIGSTN